ncbi:MAG: hypothetical protein ABEI97_04340, partial [Candidatus Nanohaloarchaea archaeon]
MMDVTVPHPATASRRFFAAVRGSLHSPAYLTAAAALTVAIYSLFALTTFPQYSWQLLSADPAYLVEAVSTLTSGMSATIGLHGVLLMVAYSALTAVAVLHVVVQFRTTGLAVSVG